MSANIISEDLRNRKTENALFSAMFSLLRKSSFRKITIKGICEEALISRATFYAHFIDKYDLLMNWMTQLRPIASASGYSYEQMEAAVNNYIVENMAVLKNLIFDADNETFSVLFDFLLTTIDLPPERDSAGEISQRYTVLSNFYAGGIISYLLWQIKNKFPPDVPPMNIYFYELLRKLRDWQSS